MNSGRVMATSLLIAFSALVGQAVALPAGVAACSCVPDPPTIAELAQEGPIAVIVGVVGQQLPDRTPVAVETWFHGEGPTDVVWVSGGSQQMTSCDPVMSAGERRLMVLHGRPGELYSSSPCVANGVLGTQSGDSALAEAVAAFGSGQGPPTPEQTDPPASLQEPTPSLGSGALWIVVAVGAAALMFGGIALLALRRQPR